MARGNRTVKRQIAETVVNSMLTGSGRGGKRGAGLPVVTVLVVLFGIVWASCNQDERSEPIESEESASVNDYSATALDSATDSESSGEVVVYNPQSSQTSDDDGRNGSYDVPKSERVRIKRCVDGDTLVVVNSAGKEERVRLIGANTPETVKKDWPVEPFGPEASEYTKRRVAETGNVATLVSDGTTYDQYNRRLAFVYLGDEKVSLNEDLCRQGLAKAQTQYSFSKEMKAKLTAAANEARREGLGIYSLSD